MAKAQVAPTGERLLLPNPGQVLGEGDDTALGALARLTARYFDAQLAVIVIEEAGRLQVRASYGRSSGQVLPVLILRTQMNSLRRVTLEIGDLAEDAGLPALPADERRAGFASYAGTTLRNDSGHAIGVLCVLDDRPRRFGREALVALTDLGRSVGAVLVLEPRATQSSLDGGLGLPGRDALEQHIEGLVATAGPLGSHLGPTCFALLRIDIGRIAVLNDMHGRAMVDQALRQVVQRLRMVAPAHSLLATLGGGSFALVVAGRVSIAEIDAAAVRVMERLREPVACDALLLPLRPSAGIASFPADALDTAGLIRGAEAAVNQAKREGDARTVHATPHLVNIERASVGLERDLQRAASSGDFSLHWMPIIDTATEQVVSFEALVRWHRPGHGEIPPSLFIPCAEAAGLIEQIDSWVLQAACGEAQSWNQALGVSVNISPLWISHDRLPTLLRRVLGQTGLDPARLQLEISERKQFSSDGMARRELARVRAMGVRLALDDFGHGYASLGLLNTYPFDQIKLDRQFVQALGRDRRAETITRSVLQMVQSLGMTCCAEGVETEEQLAFLEAHGCTEIQGYLLGHPSPWLPEPVHGQMAG